jgi:hypothetical protein
MLPVPNSSTKRTIIHVVHENEHQGKLKKGFAHIQMLDLGFCELGFG